MLVGHLLPGMLAKQQTQQAPLLYFLIISQLQDLLWLLFHFIGWEPTSPANLLLASLDTLVVDMVYSHDLVYALGWTLVAFGVGYGLYGSAHVGILSSILVLVHSMTDFISGFPHHIMGPDTATMGTGAYHSYPYLAVTFEAAFTAVTLWWFFRQEQKAGISRSARNKRHILLIFVLGIAFMYLIADLSLSEWFGLAISETTLNSTMLFMVTLFCVIIYFTNKVVKQQ